PKGEITKIPKVCGVYSFKNNKNILYIGKAASLLVRVRNHFRQPTWHDNHFINQATHIGFIKTDSEIEALLLESQLIKKYQPRYNIMLRDDKQYFYVGFSREKIPYLIITHQPKNKARYLGPFTDGKSLKTVLKYLRKVFPYYAQKHRKLPCSYCHIGLCPGPNPNIIEYKKNIAKVKAILNGKKPGVISSLKKEMVNFAKNLEFEKAAKARDQISALKNIFSHAKTYVGSETSHIEMRSIEAYDISNIQGKESVASMVRFDNGKPNKSLYRKFKIRLPQMPNDTAMIREVIRRRLAHTEWPYPDLFLIDGGRGQLNAALSQLPAKKVKVVALAKRFNELYVPGRKTPIPLDTLPEQTKNLLMHARDEAHRFAVSYHRKLHRQTFR
ncbi:MAG: UvrB/UvrC motif-containing protein, partial [Candidatus Spechtbacterales bacterium]